MTRRKIELRDSKYFYTLWKLRNFTSMIFSQKFRQIHFLLKKFILNWFDEKKLRGTQCGNYGNLPPLKNFFVKSIHSITLKWKNTLTEFLLKSRGEKLITTLCYIIGACMQSEFSQFPHLEMNTHNGVFGKGIDSPGTFLYQPFTKEFRESTSYFSKVYRYIRPRRKLK